MKGQSKMKKHQKPVARLLAAGVSLILLAVFLVSPVSAQRKMVQIKGSSTMVNLVQILAV
jgi:ABC-type phosphate transport system substrate-binding protein